MKALFVSHLILLLAVLPLAVFGQGSQFTYQGQLQSGGAPASGLFDLQFSLYNASTHGTQTGSTVTAPATPVSNGLLSVTLDFGTGVFNGSNYWLDIRVQTNGGAGYAELTPRQLITAAPYALFAPSAGLAASVTGPISLSQLPGSVLTNNAANVNLMGTFNGGGFTGTNISQLNVTNGISASTFGGGVFNGQSFSVPLVPSNQVYSSSGFVSPLIGGNIQEASGAATDGTNIYVCYNDGTNGLGVYIETHNGLGTAPLGPVVASNYLYGTGATGYNVAGGMSCYAGQLYCCVGTNFAPSLGNAVVVFNTNCVLQGVHNLGQAPNFVQYFQPVSASLALGLYFGSPAGSPSGSPYPAGSQMPWFTIGPATTGTPWLTNGQYVPLSEVTDSEGFALDPAGNAWLYGVSVPLTFQPEYNLLSSFGEFGDTMFQVSQVNTNTGAIAVVSYPLITNNLIITCGQVTGNCFFWSNDYTRLNVVVQGDGAAGPYANPNTNFIVSFPITPTATAGSNNAQINSGGLVKAPLAAFGTLTAAAGKLNNVSIAAAPNLSVTNQTTLGGLLVMTSTAKGLLSSSPSAEAFTDGEWIFNTVNNFFNFCEGGTGSALLWLGNASQNGAEFWVQINANHGVSNAPIFSGSANGSIITSNAAFAHLTLGGGSVLPLNTVTGGTLTTNGISPNQYLSLSISGGGGSDFIGNNNGAGTNLALYGNTTNALASQTNAGAWTNWYGPNVMPFTNSAAGFGLDTNGNLTAPGTFSSAGNNFRSDLSGNLTAATLLASGNVTASGVITPTVSGGAAPFQVGSSSPTITISATTTTNTGAFLTAAVTTESNIFSASASASGQITIYNYFPSSAFSPTNCAYDWRSGPCYMASSLAGYLIATNSWLYTPGAGTNEVVAVSFSFNTAYTPSGAGQSTFATPASAIFTNGPTRGGVVSAPASLGGAPATRLAAMTGLTGWSIWATNGSASAGRTVAWGHAENQ